MLYQPTIFPQILGLLRASLGDAAGNWYDRLLASEGLTGCEFGTDPSSLALGKFETVYLACIEYSGRTDLAFDTAWRMNPGHFGLLGAAARNCASIGQLLQLHVRYFRLASSAFRSTSQDSEAGLLWMRRPAAFMAPPVLAAMLEFYAVGTCRYLACFLPGGQLPRFDITIGMEAPPHAGRYRQLHPVQCHFGSTRLPEIACFFPREILGLPLTPAVELPQSAAGEIDSLVRSLRRGGDAAQWIRLMLMHCQDCQPTKVELAELLNVSARTLTRMLATSGLSLRQIGNEVRHRRACQLLTETAEPILHIALRLGYSDASNFAHAFRRASGVSPRSFRRRARPAD